MFGPSNSRLLDEMHDLKLMVIDINSEIVALKRLVLEAEHRHLQMV